MASGIIYLDVDDEITSAAARIRAAEATKVALVVPYGSRVATSRINFRLLSREALERNRRLSIVAADAATRALAGSAGLPVFGSVSEYEAALAEEMATRAAEGDEEDGPKTGAAAGLAIAGAGGSAAIDAATAAEAARPSAAASRAAERHAGITPSEPPPPAAAAGAAMVVGAAAVDGPTIEPARSTSSDDPRSSRASADPVPVARPRARGPRLGPGALLGIGLLVVALVVGGVGAFLFLPAATVTVTPRTDTIGPVQIPVRADPNATQPDTTRGVIPAEQVSVNVTAQDTFAATGKRVEESPATGQVQFDSVNTVGPVAVPSGSRVSTLDGVVFVTTQSVMVPKAQVAGTTIKHGFASAPIRAVKPGPEGNQEANSITQVPAGLSVQQVSATNPNPTSGGARQEFPQVSPQDVDAAVQALTTRLQADFDAEVDAGAGAAAGETVLKETAKLGEPVPSVDPATLVGSEAESFDLAMAATGTVLAVDTTPIEAIALERLRASVGDEYAMVDDSIDIQVGDATVVGEEITFPVRASAKRVLLVDPEDLRSLVKGRTADEARELLEPFGLVDVDTWPDWVTTIPTFDQRLTIVVVGDQPAGSGSPSPSASGSAPRSTAPAGATPPSSPSGSGSPAP